MTSRVFFRGGGGANVVDSIKTLWLCHTSVSREPTEKKALQLNEKDQDNKYCMCVGFHGTREGGDE